MSDLLSEEIGDPVPYDIPPEEPEPQNVGFDAEEEIGDQDTGIRKQVAIGMQPHPLTGEMGVVLRIGEESTWLPFGDALQLSSQVHTTAIVGIATGAASQLVHLAQQQQQQGSKLVIPGR